MRPLAPPTATWPRYEQCVHRCARGLASPGVGNGDTAVPVSWASAGACVQALGLATDLLLDEDCSVVFANRGGDAHVKRLMRATEGAMDDDGSAVYAAAAEVAGLRAACTVPGRGFPARCAVLLSCAGAA